MRVNWDCVQLKGESTWEGAIFSHKERSLEFISGQYFISIIHECILYGNFRLYYWTMPVQIFLYFTSEWCLARNSSDHNVKWAIPFHEWPPPPLKEDIGFHWPPNILDVPVAYTLPYPHPQPSIFFAITLYQTIPIPLPGLKTATPPPDFYFNITPTIPRPYIFSHPTPTPRLFFL